MGNRTYHAEIRAQQRGIPPAIQFWLKEFGAIEYSHDARKRFFDKQARKRMAKELGSEVVDRLGDLMNCYLVESLNGDVITVAHRTERIRERVRSH